MVKFEILHFWADFHGSVFDCTRLRLVIERWRDFENAVRPKLIRSHHPVPPALEALLQSLRQTKPKFEDFYRRVALIKSIRELGHPKAIPDLEEILRTDTQQYDAWGLGVAISVAERVF